MRRVADIGVAEKVLDEPSIHTLICQAIACRMAEHCHGLRVSEAVGLRRNEVDIEQARLWVRWLKNGISVEQPIAGDKVRAIKRYT